MQGWAPVLVCQGLGALGLNDFVSGIVDDGGVFAGAEHS